MARDIFSYVMCGRCLCFPHCAARPAGSTMTKVRVCRSSHRIRSFCLPSTNRSLRNSQSSRPSVGRTCGLFFNIAVVHYTVRTPLHMLPTTMCLKCAAGNAPKQRDRALFIYQNSVNINISKYISTPWMIALKVNIKRKILIRCDILCDLRYLLMLLGSNAHLTRTSKGAMLLF